MIAIDTNLLVYAHRTATPEHRRAQRAIEQAAAAGEGWGFAQTTVAEFWSLVTHPAAAGRPSQPREAAGFIGALVDAGAEIWTAGADFGTRLTQTAADLHVTGVRIFDLQIALTVFEAGARAIWTHDASFVAVPGLRVVDPLRG